MGGVEVTRGPGVYGGEVRVSSLYPNVTRVISVTLIVARGAFVPVVSPANTRSRAILREEG